VKHTPFWVEDFPRPSDLTTDLPSTAEVLVVGSGLTGLSAALRLAEAGRAVTVIDGGDIAGGASAINGGMVSPDVKAGVRAVYRRHGPEIGRAMWDSSVRSIELVKEIDRRQGVDALIHQGGMAAVGKGEQDRRMFERSLSWYRDQLGVHWELLGPDRIGDVIGGDYFDVAIFEPESYGVHPARLSFGLAAEVRDAGASLVDSCTALAIHRTPSGHRVDTNLGPVRAGEVILATNGYTTRAPSSDLARLIVPIGSYIIVTEPVGPDIAGRIFPGGAMSYTKKRLLHYMRRTPDDRILIGGRRNLHTGLDLDESAADLRQALLRYWPELAGYEITHAWGGKLAVPFDLVPHIGKVGGAWYALGYAGHGVGLSVQLGHELAGMILGADPPSVFSRVPHRGRFYYTGTPWFLTPASILYRTLDRMGR
jgi:glycine/D-amino acid oxidase-like deaminating enzyme